MGPINVTSQSNGVKSGRGDLGFSGSGLRPIPMSRQYNFHTGNSFRLPDDAESPDVTARSYRSV